jgi:MFS family permease
MTRTTLAYVWTRVLDTPFWALFNLLIFMLYKELHATPLQLAIMISLKPMSSILASYWCARVHQKPERLVSSIITARWLAYIPFLAFPFVHNLWYLIACSGIFMFLQVGMMPSWMELLKQNVPDNSREKVFSYMQTVGYLGSGLLMFFLGAILDTWSGSWKWMFPIAAIIALLAQLWQRTITVEASAIAPSIEPPPHPILKPWKSAFEVLKHHRDFAKFQVGFLLFGSGLMILQPILPVFLEDGLHLSYLEIGVAISFCKGIGFACSSPLWGRWIQQLNIFRLSSIISLLATIFPFLLIAAQVHLVWLYMAYVIYGLMQAGSELSWNMSGPIFAKKEDSSPFSSVNVMSVGIRGLFIPSLGALCFSYFGLYSVILLSGTLFISSMLVTLFFSREASRVNIA